MASVGAARPAGRILLAVAGDDEDWSVLRGDLFASRWQVDLAEISTLDPEADGVDDLLPPLDDIDAMIAVLARTRGDDLLAPERRLAQLSHLLGVAQGRLGPARILALVESELSGLLAGTGIPETPYRRHEIEAQFGQVRAMLAEIEAETSPPTGLMARVRAVTGTVAPELWLLLAPLLVLGAFLAVLGLGLLSWRSPSRAPALSQIQIDPAALAAASTTVPGGPAGDLVAGPSVAALPANCVIEIPAGAILAPEMACDSGHLKLDGFRGPWHNEIASVAIDSGVIGQVSMAPRSSQPARARIQLHPGSEQVLGPYDPDDGVDRIELTFAANAQRVTLHQDPGRGGRTAVVTFSLR